MDWKKKLVLPPNYVSLRYLKELREKEKAELELKLREEAEAEYKSRLEEEERLTKLKEEEEKRRVDEENRQKEEEEKKMREKEEEDRLRREIIRRDRILKTRTLLCGEPSGRRIRRRQKFKKYSDDDDDGVNQVIGGDEPEEEIKKEIVTEAVVIKDENLEEGMKKKGWGKKWGSGKGKKKDSERKKAPELESQTLKSETNLESKGFVDKTAVNQTVEEIEKKIGDLNLDMKKKKKSKAAKQFPQPQINYVDRCPHSQIKNLSKHGKRIDSAMNPRNASGSSLVWVARTD